MTPAVRAAAYESSSKMSHPPNTRSSSEDSGTISSIFGERPSVRLPRRTVPICVSDPIGLARPFRIASTPAMVVVLTAPRPTSRTPSLPTAGAMSTGTGMRVKLYHRHSAREQAGRHLYEKRIEPIAAHVRRPDEIGAGDVEIALRPLRVIVAVDVAAARRVEIGHHRRHHQHIERSVGVLVRVEGKADDLVGHVGDGARVAAARKLRLGRGESRVAGG